MTVIRSMLAAVAVSALLGVQANGAADVGFRVIVHPNNSVASLTPDEVSRIFLKRTRTWENGQSIQVVDLAPSSPVRASFSKSIHHRTVANVTSFWQQQLFSGTDVPPPERASETEVVAFVRSNPNAIGYVGNDTAIEGTKVINLGAPGK